MDYVYHMSFDMLQQWHVGLTLRPWCVINGHKCLVVNCITQGQMHYATPRNACRPVDHSNVSAYSWVALIENYYDCPDNSVSDGS